MYDIELSKEILHNIYKACQTILERFKPVNSVNDFTNSPAGMEKLDSICMQLIAIGESLKNFDKVTNKSILVQYPQIDWKRAIGLRDIISHHYFDVNAEAIFNICSENIKPLADTIKQISDDLH